MENDMKVQRFDSLPLDATYFTDEGYLVDHPIVTSVGIFVYHNPDGSERRELRLPEEVFAEKSLASYKGKPIIVTHDAGYVDTDNVKDERPTAVLPQSRLRRPPVLLKANSRMQFSRSKTAVTAAILRATRQICPAQWA